MQLHYFQRYHSKENVDTANTMLMLSRLYHYNSEKFFAMINDIVLKAEDSPELRFDLQVSGTESVPDAVISQKSFKVVVETKLYNQFDKNQLLKHLNQFGNEEIKVLLTLDPYPMKKTLLAEFTDILTDFNKEHTKKFITPICHINLTFEQLVTAMEDIVDDRDIEITGVLDDFKQYCFDEKLIPDAYKWMRAIVAGTTIKENIELGLFYDKASRGYSEHGYVGLYNQKSIKAIGKLSKIISAWYNGDNFEYAIVSGEAPNNDEIDRIKKAIDISISHGYDLRSELHKYFIVDEFYPIDFKKTSKNPIQKSKYFNLQEMFAYQQMPTTKQIANDLNGKTWEQF